MSTVSPPITARAQRHEEQHLVRRILANDPQACEELATRYSRLITASVLRVLRRYHALFVAEDVADIVSEVWIALLRDDRHKLRVWDARRGCRLSSWLALIATNHTIDHLRMRADIHESLDAMLQPERLLVDHARGPEHELELRQAAALAQRALGELKEDEQHFLISYFRDERPPVDLARELGISVNTIHSRKFKVRQKLSQIVERIERRRARRAA